MVPEIVLMGSIAGLKLAVFLIVLVYAYLADIALKNKSGIHFLNVVAVAFMIMAIGEFLHVMSLDEVETGEVAVWPWIMSFENLEMFMEILSTIAGVGLLLYFLHLNNNVKDYR